MIIKTPRIPSSKVLLWILVLQRLSYRMYDTFTPVAKLTNFSPNQLLFHSNQISNN